MTKKLYKLVNVQLRDGRWETQIKRGRTIIVRFDFYHQAQKWIEDREKQTVTEGYKP